MGGVVCDGNQQVRFEGSLGMVKKLLQQRRRLQDSGPQYHRCGHKARIIRDHQRQMRAPV